MIAADILDRPTARADLSNTADVTSADPGTTPSGLPGDPEFPSWNYSDVMKGLDEFLDIVPNFASSGEDSQGVAQAYTDLNDTVGRRKATDKSVALKRRQYKNKLAQQRFRDRQKARSDELEAQVRATSAQLEEMQRKQKTLEARNTMLEKLVNLDRIQTGLSQGSPVVNQSTFGAELGFTTMPGPLAELVVTSPHLKLSLPTIKTQEVAVSDFAEMSLPAYAKLHTEYIRQLGACFAMLAKGLQPDDPQSPVLMQLQQWAIECALLLIATAFSSPKALRNLYHCNFADGAITDKDLPQHFYQGLVDVSAVLAGVVTLCEVALDLSDSQVQDVLYLRQLFYGKRGQLARQRQALLEQFEKTRQAEDCVLDSVVEWTEIADRLCKNAKEEYRTTMQLAATLHIGIYCMKQWATAFVYAYPWLPMHTSSLEAIAAQRGGEPSPAALAQDDSIDDSQHAANWEDVITYLATLDATAFSQHVPLLPQTLG